MNTGTNQRLADAASGAAVELSVVQLPAARPRQREQEALAQALAQERRRIAADVHDLIMQDLAFALATARALADEAGSSSLARILVAASERALAGARHVVGTLDARDREPVIDAVEASARVAARYTPLSFDGARVPAGAEPDQPTLDALVHIAREAVTNAIKHAAPGAVEVTLERADEWRLEVRDDGIGFDAGACAAGFGLHSMRRHAHALGGSLNVTTVAGAGSVVEAILP